MAKQINDGGPVHPSTEFPVDDGEVLACHPGWSLRDWLAAHAPPMPPEVREAAMHALRERAERPPSEWQAAYLYLVAKWRYRYADQMLRARQRCSNCGQLDSGEPALKGDHKCVVCGQCIKNETVPGEQTAEAAP